MLLALDLFVLMRIPINQVVFITLTSYNFKRALKNLIFKTLDSEFKVFLNISSEMREPTLQLKLCN